MTEPGESSLTLAATARTLQLAVRAALMRDVAKLWPILNPARLDDTFPAWLQAMKAVVTNYHGQSSMAAGRSYSAMRENALEERTPSGIVKLAPVPPAEWLERALGYSGPGMLTRDKVQPNTALSTTLGTSARIALDGGRATTLRTLHADDKAVGWYRVTDGHPCAFCAMLAARGVVYKSTTVGFQAHNDCGCTGAPAFSRDQELPEISRAAQEAYRNRGPGPALPAFRKAWDEHLAANGGGSEPPSPPTRGGSGGDGPDDVASRLDESYQPWADALTDEQRAAIARWQATDRFYQQIQNAIRAGTGSPEVNALVQRLSESVYAGRLPFDVDMYRGVRSSRAVFGRDATELEDLVGQTVPLTGFFAGTIDKQVAVDQFTAPPLAGGPVLFHLTMRQGTAAAWIALAGDPDLRGQMELLVGPAVSLRIVSVSYSDGVTVIEGEVV